MRETKAGFRLPDDASVPIIMIGPGTGLAPFRGFLQERAARKAKGATLGPAMLFFGCRHPDQDYLYADELKAFAADGITELHTAFSRAEGPKTYVQNLVAAQKDRVWSLIEQGAIIYVCGDGGKMEPDVKAALVAIYRERNGGGRGCGAALDRRSRRQEPLRARRLGRRVTSSASDLRRDLMAPLTISSTRGYGSRLAGTTMYVATLAVCGNARRSHALGIWWNACLSMV